MEVIKCRKCGSDKLRSNGTTKQGAYKRLKCNKCNVANDIHISRYRYENSIHYKVQKVNKKELVKYSGQLQKEKQKLADRNRIERNTWRKNTRLDNTLEELTKVLIKELQKNKVKSTPKLVKKANIPGTKTLIIQLSDLHLNEKILQPDTISRNQYDFDIAKRRLAEFADKAIDYIKFWGIKNVKICNTGDTLNSSRRLTELVTNIYPITKAFIESYKLIKGFIDYIKFSEIETIEYYSVVGNESRLENKWCDDNNYDSFWTMNNWDYAIHEMLKETFEHDFYVDIKSQDNYKEYKFQCHGKNIVMKHGEDLTTRKSIEKCVNKYALNREFIDKIIMGHIHAEWNDSTIVTRSPSMCGGNNYAEKQLNCFTKAAQMIYLVDQNSINSTVIDLSYIN